MSRDTVRSLLLYDVLFRAESMNVSYRSTLTDARPRLPDAPEMGPILYIILVPLAGNRMSDV